MFVIDQAFALPCEGLHISLQLPMERKTPIGRKRTVEIPKIDIAAKGGNTHVSVPLVMRVSLPGVSLPRHSTSPIAENRC